MSLVHKDLGRYKSEGSERKAKEKGREIDIPQQSRQFVTLEKSLLQRRENPLVPQRKLETSKTIELTLSLSWTCLNYKN